MKPTAKLSSPRARAKNAHSAWPQVVERACAAKGLALTPLRANVLAIIAKAPAPLGAYAILEALSRGAKKAVAPPTVYRALEFFLDNGFVHKIESRNAYAPCEHIGHAHQGVLMVCGACGRSDEVESAEMEDLLHEISARAGFVSRRQVVELQGLCRTCASGAANLRQ